MHNQLHLQLDQAFLQGEIKLRIGTCISLHLFTFAQSFDTMSNSSNATSRPDEVTARYEALRAQLKEGMERKRQTDHDLTDLESQIYLYEGSYLNNTAMSGGNVIRGFDSYLKAGSTPASVSRSSSQTISGDDRMFSTSSATYQRSLALKFNEPAPEKADDAKISSQGSQASGYKLKRKTDETTKRS